MLETLIGAILIVVVLADIFLLVLYARAGVGIFSNRLASGIWRFFVLVSPLFGRARSRFLTLAGPVIVVLVILMWMLLLSLASALIIHPTLGTGVRALHEETPTDFITALYVGGSSLDIISQGNFEPQTSAFRLFYVFASIVGVFIVTLTVTYLMEVYTALRKRNTLGLQVHLLSGETGDAAEVVAHLGPSGKFDLGYNNLVEWSGEIAETKEAHHFYTVLFYFRFNEPFYSISRTALTSLDTIALIRTALDENEYGWFQHAASVEDLERGTLLELKTVARAFLPEAEEDVPLDERTRARWTQRYRQGVERLQRAGIKTTDAKADEYVAARCKWDHYITKLATAFGYEMDEIDTALAHIKA